MNYMLKTVMIVVLISMTFVSKANEVADSLLKKGNDYYMQHQYAMAERCYTRILQLGYESGDVYFNLGNSYYKQSMYAKAVLNYERALQLNPGQKDIKDNLALANMHIIDRIEVIPEFFLKRWISALGGIFSPDQWAIAALVLFALALFSLVVYFIAGNLGVKKFGFVSGIVLLVFSGISLSFMFNRVKSIRNNEHAIVMVPSVNARSSPDEQSTSVFVLHEGTKVMITDSVQRWKEIKIANGNTGWIQSAALEEI